MCSDDGVVADYSGAHGLEHVVLRALYVAGEEALIDLHGVFDHGRGAVFLAEEDVYALLRLEGGVMLLYALSAVLGAAGARSMIWEIADLLNALMALPNLISLFLLSGEAARLTRGHFAQRQRE